jgi:sugar lactone lactonase YvrE
MVRPVPATAAEQVTPALTEHGEGVIWDEVAGLLRWVDLLGGDVLSMDLGSGDIERLNVGTRACAIRPRRAGGLVIGVERGFALLASDPADLRVLPEVWSDPTVRMNDGTCDPQGRFYCGSMAYDEAPGRGALHRLDPDGTTTEVLGGVTISNGIAWEIGGEEVLYVDTPTGRIDRFDFDAGAGTLHGRRPFVNVDPKAGLPDGIAIDAEGGVWVALWGGGAVHRYDGDGVLSARVALPVPNVTACALVGGDLFVTTSAVGEPTDGAAGALFRCPVGVGPGPVPTFAG